MLKIFELLKNTKNLIIFAITCIVVCIVGEYRNFDFVEIGSFKLSFDFMFFVALVGAVVSSTILIWKILSIFFSWVRGFSILKTLINCSNEEKDFLYNRVYENGNERQIDMNHDKYFYKDVCNIGDIWDTNRELYKNRFNTKEKTMKFIRQLENKGIIKNYGNQSMTIPLQVWNILIKYADEIFKGFTPLPIEPTEGEADAE